MTSKEWRSVMILLAILGIASVLAVRVLFDPGEARRQRAAADWKMGRLQAADLAVRNLIAQGRWCDAWRLAEQEQSAIGVRLYPPRDFRKMIDSCRVHG